MQNLEKYFPYDQIRPQQKEILNFIEQNADKKVFLINAPTGVGKSGIAMAIARACTGKAWLLTETKALQDQYSDEFTDEVVSLKGKNSYTCNLQPSVRADEAPCIGHKETKALCVLRKACDYYMTFQKGMDSKILATNYNYALGFSETRNPLAMREVTICDEGHVIEDKLVEQAAFDINPKMLHERYRVEIDPALPFEDFETVENICEYVSDQITKRCEAVREEIDQLPHKFNSEGQKTNVDPREKALNRVLDSLTRHLKRIENYLFDPEDNWVTDISDDLAVITIQPLKSNGLFKKYFMDNLTEQFGQIFIMSASLGDFDTVISEFGLSEDEVACIDVDTPFDPNKSPVVIMPSVKLGYKDFNASKAELISVIDSLLDEHPDQKGIIHSGNYKTAEHIALKSKHQKRLVFKSADEKKTSNTDLFAVHSIRDDGSVLLSPSMHTGVDLKGSLAEFQIIAKLPFANLRDARVKAKMEDDPLWYSNATWQKIIQACGRATRNMDDSSITYIIDAAAKRQYSQFKKHLPTWFLNRVIFV
jgi:ATP-dependent DNA helicase DinG